MPDYQVHKIFPCPVFQYQLKNFKKINSELESYILDLKKKFPEGIKKSNSGDGWQTFSCDLSSDEKQLHNNKLRHYMLQHFNRVI